MRTILVNGDPTTRLKGKGSQTSTRTITLNLPELGTRLRRTAREGDRWVTETLAAHPSAAHYEAVRGGGAIVGVVHAWRHLAIGIADPGGLVIVWAGWFFLDYTPGSRKIARMILDESQLGAGSGSGSGEGILDLFDGRVKRPERLAAARESIRLLWESSTTVVDRLVDLLGDNSG